MQFQAFVPLWYETDCRMSLIWHPGCSVTGGHCGGNIICVILFFTVQSTSRFFFSFPKTEGNSERSLSLRLVKDLRSVRHVTCSSSSTLARLLIAVSLPHLQRIHCQNEAELTAVQSVDTFDLTAPVGKQFQELESIVANFCKR